MKKVVGFCMGLAIGLAAFAGEKPEGAISAFTVESVAETAEMGILHDNFVFTFLPIIPPNPSEMFLQPIERLVAFDESGFKSRFLNRLIGEMDPVSGAPIYTVYTMMDASDSSVVIFNENLRELTRIPRDETYSPFAWAESKFGAALTPELMALYNPARMIAEYRLIPADYVDYHLAAMEQQALVEAIAAPKAKVSAADSGGVSIRLTSVSAPASAVESEEPEMSMMTMSGPPPPPGGGGGGGSGSGGGLTNQIVELAFMLPAGCGPYAEIFRKQNLIYPQLWSVAVNRMAVTGGVEAVWADPVSSNAPTMFYIVGDTSAGVDDGDGYSELRERYVTGTDPAVFNHVETDGDGLHDWFEIFYFGDLSQSDTGDFDSDGLTNGEELTMDTNGVQIIANPTLPDTDGDGATDGAEVAQGSDPSDPTDNGQPPSTTAVTLSVESFNPNATYTLTVTSGSTNHVVTSAGTEPVSQSFDLVKGQSYSFSLVQGGSPACGDPVLGYDASISGNGIYVEDPDTTLGNHWGTQFVQNPATGAVHVVKIETETEATTPSNRKRKMIGVGERVKLTFLPTGLAPLNWSVSGGGTFDEEIESSVVFIAPAKATNTTVAAAYNDETYPLSFSVIEPTGVTVADFAENDHYAVGEAGSGMALELWLEPATVSFGNLEVMEVGTVSTDATGYFANTNVFLPNLLDHGANGANVPISVQDNNRIDWDAIGTETCQQPWENGHFSWTIPAVWWVEGTTATNSLPWSNQHFYIDSSGTVTVEKFGYAATRGTNSIYTVTEEY